MPSEPGKAAEGLLVAAMWTYAGQILYPTQLLKRAGLWRPAPYGDLPLPPGRPGLGPRFSKDDSNPVLLASASEYSDLVVEFDRMAEVYALFTEPFSKPIFDEALAEMEQYLTRDSRVLDAGCGAGHELQRIARMVPEGEVVGIDLAAGMVNSAWRDARAHGLTNCAFFQADVSALPPEFEEEFDVAYSALAHHHYPDPAAASARILRCLRPGGIYCVIDPGPAWFNAMSSEIARRCDPGWIGFHSPKEFRDLFAAAGFGRTAWIDLLPGFGLALGQKSFASGS
jgi:ubiquinone/menaquinone biosynthesis C-methylase UbiE